MTTQSPVRRRPSTESLVTGVALAASLALFQAYALGFSFTGKITEVSDSAHLLPAEITVGATFSGTFSFDPSRAGADLDPAANFGQYYFKSSDGSDFSFSVTIGGHVWHSQPAPLFNRNWVSVNNGFADYLTYETGVVSRDGTALPSGLGDESLNLSFYDPSGAALGSDAVPNLLPLLTVFTGGASLNFAAEDSEGNRPGFSGIIQSVVPGPAHADGLTILKDGGVEITGTGTAGRSYSVEACNQPGSSWTVLGAATADPAGLIKYVDQGASGLARRFYRFTASQ